MKLPENPGYGTICRTPSGNLWVRTGHDEEHPWNPVDSTGMRIDDKYVREKGWEVVWSPDEPAPDPVHRIVIADGLMTFECHAPANWPCHAVYDCDCEEWFASGVDDGVPWHQTDAFSPRERHFGRFDPQECNARDWIDGQGELDSQRPGPDGRILVPVEVSWTGHGVEWSPAKGGAR